MDLKHFLSSNDADSYTNVPLLLALFPLFLLCVLFPIVYLRISPFRLPPGPPALPVIGHLHLLGKEPHRSFWELSMRYGSLISLRLGSTPVIIASSPEAARLILQKHDQVFSSRPRAAIPMQIYECKNLLFSDPGSYFKLVRQLAFSHLLGKKRLESFRPFISNEIRHLLCEVLNTSSMVFVRRNLYETTFSIVSRMLIGKHRKDILYHSSKGASYSLRAAVLEIVDLLGTFNIGDHIPFLAWMDLQGCLRRSKSVSQRVKAILGDVIHERRHKRKNTVNEVVDTDFLDALLAASSNQNEVPVTDAHIIAILVDMFAGGIDTSTIAIEWALAELIRQPHILKKVQDELSLVAGSTRLVEEPDVGSLPYLRAVVKETMRLHPVVPLLVPHATNQQCQINGYDILPGTQAYVNVWAIGRDASVWEMPLKFYPERFLDSDMDLRGQDFELLPFGSGRRICPGLSLGINNVHLMLANILHVCDWSALGEINMTEKFGLVCSLANPLMAKVALRVPREVLET